MTERQILDDLKRICQSYEASELVLFGSRARKTNTARSDFDLAVSGVRDFPGLSEAIETIPTLLRFDLVNLDTCKNDLLLKEIRQYGRKIL